MIIPPSIPVPQTIPPEEAGEIAIIAASTALCAAFAGILTPEDLQPAMDRGLASVGLLPVPPHQIVSVWSIALDLVQDPRVCPKLLTP